MASSAPTAHHHAHDGLVVAQLRHVAQHVQVLAGRAARAGAGASTRGRGHLSYILEFVIFFRDISHLLHVLGEGGLLGQGLGVGGRLLLL